MEFNSGFKGLNLKVCRYNILAAFTYLLYLLILCSRVLLEKLTESRLVKKFPALYETRKFITVFTDACHLSIS